MRHSKMAEWMENVEKSIARIMADKVYTSSEFKRERDNFHVSGLSILQHLWNSQQICYIGIFERGQKILGVFKNFLAH